MLDLSHKKMVVWKKSLLLIKEVYQITDNFPLVEKFGITSQLRRAAISVISNISEGEARQSPKEKRRFYDFACASLVEIDAQIEVSLMLQYLSLNDVNELSELLNECFAMLSTLRKSR